MKKLYEDWYRPHNSFILRSPLAPVHIAFDADDKIFDIQASKEYTRKNLRFFYEQPIIREALYVGSPDMYRLLQLWMDNKIEDNDKKEKAEISLLKYMTRICTRCTPFGLFATCTAGTMDDRTKIRWEDNSLQRVSRLDMDYICTLHEELLARREISTQLRFFPNNSLYRYGGQWRYIEYRSHPESGRSYHLVELGSTEYLDKIIDAARAGLRPDELAAVITDDDVSRDAAFEFIYEMISTHVLVDELAPVVTGDDYFTELLQELKSLRHTDNYVEVLERTRELISQINEAERSHGPDLYRQVAEELDALESVINHKTLIQVDSYRKTTVCVMNRKIVDEILRGISLLHLLRDGDDTGDSFSGFRKAFLRRYDGQWVPLAAVLDTESGIGYGKFTTGGMDESPLVDNLPIGNGHIESLSRFKSRTESYKWQLYQQAISEHKTEVCIDDRVIEQLLEREGKASGLPDSMSAMVKIWSSSAQDIDNGNYTLQLNSVGGPSGANLLGRFCQLHPDIRNFVADIIREEEAHLPDCIYAEIVHLPESRIGNILTRPVLRRYEIPYLCRSPLNEAYQIPLADLLVGIEGDHVVLRSQKLKREVIPRLTTAHNFHQTTLPVYRFLCDLQYQHTRSFGWHWGTLDNRPFLPRVSYGRFVLARARWMLVKEDLKDCYKKSDEEVLKGFTEVMRKNRLPRFVLLSQGDNELLLDVQNIYNIKLLLAELVKTDSVLLIEMLDTPDQCWIESPEGRHSSEFIFSFSRKRPETPLRGSGNGVAGEDIRIPRSFPVGSEWLYAKIYCGTKTAEKILCTVLKPMADAWIAEKVIDKFFFLRYHDDGGHHIRIRYHNSQAETFWINVISCLRHRLQPYMDYHTVHDLRFETYSREVERYGAETMDLSEELFWHQSRAVLDFISKLDGDEGEQYRWQVVLKAIDLFLDDFLFTLERKYGLIKQLENGFSSEFKIGASERNKISLQFRGHKQQLEILMGDGWQEDPNLKIAIDVFMECKDAYRETIDEILRVPSVKSNSTRLEQLVQDYLHMFINRVFVSNQRKTEAIIYYYLLKYYESQLARSKVTLQSC